MAVVFYPYAFSGVCTGEMAGIRDRLAELMTFGSEVLRDLVRPGLQPACVRGRRRSELPAALGLLAARRGVPAYDVFNEVKGCPRRSSYVVDREGVVRWSVHSDGPARDLDEHVRQLQKHA